MTGNDVRRKKYLFCPLEGPVAAHGNERIRFIIGWFNIYIYIKQWVTNITINIKKGTILGRQHNETRQQIIQELKGLFCQGTKQMLYFYDFSCFWCRDFKEVKSSNPQYPIETKEHLK